MEFLFEYFGIFKLTMMVVKERDVVIVLSTPRVLLFTHSPLPI